MKIKAVVLSCITGVLILSTLYVGTGAGIAALGKSEPGGAESETDNTCLKIGVVSIREIFHQSARIAAYREEATAERRAMESKLNALAEKIKAEETALNLLTPGSSDYMSQWERMHKQRASYEVEKELYNKKVSLKEQKITEDLYMDILRATREVAEEKGLDLVFEKSEPELPAPNPTQLELAMGTHKVLYSGGCPDISRDVLARIESADRKKPEAMSNKPQ